MFIGVSTSTQTAGQTEEPSEIANVLRKISPPTIFFSKYVFFQHILPQKIAAVKSTEWFEMLFTKMESTGIGRIISSSSKTEQAEMIVAKKRNIICFILLSS
jgi:hypothetical protein